MSRDGPYFCTGILAKSGHLPGIHATALTTTHPKLLSPDAYVENDDSDGSEKEVAEDIDKVPGDIALTEQSKSYLGWTTSYRQCVAEKPCKVKALAKLRKKSEAFRVVLSRIPPANRVQPWHFDLAALENRKKRCKLIASRAKEARSFQPPLLCDES